MARDNRTSTIDPNDHSYHKAFDKVELDIPEYGRIICDVDVHHYAAMSQPDAEFAQKEYLLGDGRAHGPRTGFSITIDMGEHALPHVVASGGIMMDEKGNASFYYTSHGKGDELKTIHGKNAQRLYDAVMQQIDRMPQKGVNVPLSTHTDTLDTGEKYEFTIDDIHAIRTHQFVPQGRTSASDATEGHAADPAVDSTSHGRPVSSIDDMLTPDTDRSRITTFKDVSINIPGLGQVDNCEVTISQYKPLDKADAEYAQKEFSIGDGKGWQERIRFTVTAPNGDILAFGGREIDNGGKQRDIFECPDAKNPSTLSSDQYPTAAVEDMFHQLAKMPTQGVTEFIKPSFSMDTPEGVKQFGIDDIHNMRLEYDAFVQRSQNREEMQEHIIPPTSPNIESQSQPSPDRSYTTRYTGVSLDIPGIGKVENCNIRFSRFAPMSQEDAKFAQQEYHIGEGKAHGELIGFYISVPDGDSRFPSTGIAGGEIMVDDKGNTHFFFDNHGTGNYEHCQFSGKEAQPMVESVMSQINQIRQNTKGIDIPLQSFETESGEKFTINDIHKMRVKHDFIESHSSEEYVKSLQKILQKKERKSIWQAIRDTIKNFFKSLTGRSSSVREDRNTSNKSSHRDDLPPKDAPRVPIEQDAPQKDAPAQDDVSKAPDINDVAYRTDSEQGASNLAVFPVDIASTLPPKENLGLYLESLQRNLGDMPNPIDTHDGAFIADIAKDISSCIKDSDAPDKTNVYGVGGQVVTMNYSHDKDMCEISIANRDKTTTTTIDCSSLKQRADNLPPEITNAIAAAFSEHMGKESIFVDSRNGADASMTYLQRQTETGKYESYRADILYSSKTSNRASNYEVIEIHGPKIVAPETVNALFSTRELTPEIATVASKMHEELTNPAPYKSTFVTQNEMFWAENQSIVSCPARWDGETMGKMPVVTEKLSADAFDNSDKGQQAIADALKKASEEVRALTQDEMQQYGDNIKDSNDTPPVGGNNPIGDSDVGSGDIGDDGAMDYGDDDGFDR